MNAILRHGRFPPLGWLMLLAVALWPQIRWMAQRMGDGSDDPLGIVAWGALAVLGWRYRRHLYELPHPGWSGVALVSTLLATVAWGHAPPMVSALFAATAFAAGLLAFLPAMVGSAPVLGLALLSLPLMASLQFYAGYPLRLVAAELSRWLLMPWFDVARDGVALKLDGQLLLVDAACSGVQLVWFGYFTACVGALLCGCGNRHFFARLPLVGGLVLLGNVVRNAVLLAAQADGQTVADWLHQGVGLVVLAGVCVMIAWIMTNTSSRTTGAHGSMNELRVAGYRKATLALLLFLPACALWHLPGTSAANAATEAATAAAEAVAIPKAWEGRPLHPLALSKVEQRFAQGFPGKIARLSDGQNVLIWRHVTQATRMLHPATDCYRAMGWRIRDEQLEMSAWEKRWRCFTAELASENKTLRVCERIEDANGQAYTDTSAWYWAAITGQSTGPWQAITVASAM